MVRLATGASYPAVSDRIIEESMIPIPEFVDQRRIADILDMADAIRRKRRQATNLTDELVQATFLDMVGPGARCYQQWPEQTIEDLAQHEPRSMRTGPFGSDLLHSEFVDSGIAVLGIDNAVKNRFTWDERRYISQMKYDELQRFTVYPNDVIITIMGTTGRSAVVPEDIPTAITTKHLACITLNRQIAEPEFVSNAVHRHPGVLAQIGASHRGAIMPGLNLTLIKSLELHVPPIDTQRRFTRFINRARSQQDRLVQVTDETDNLFNALVQRAFRGDLQ
jgi:type I restriction enzyme, S subunit